MRFRMATIQVLTVKELLMNSELHNLRICLEKYECLGFAGQSHLEKAVDIVWFFSAVMFDAILPIVTQEIESQRITVFLN